MPVYKSDDAGGVPMVPMSPGGNKNYALDLAASTNGNGSSDWLDTANGEQISSYVITPDSGITVANDSLTNSNTAIQFYATSATAGTYSIEIEVTTNATPAIVESFTMIIEVIQR